LETSGTLRFCKRGWGRFLKRQQKWKNDYVGLLKKPTPVVRVFAQKRLLPKKLRIGRPRAAMVRALIQFPFLPPHSVFIPSNGKCHRPPNQPKLHNFSFWVDFFITIGGSSAALWPNVGGV
jgi:hypothetical protein